MTRLSPTVPHREDGGKEAEAEEAAMVEVAAAARVAVVARRVATQLEQLWCLRQIIMVIRLPFSTGRMY